MPVGDETRRRARVVLRIRLVSDRDPRSSPRAAQQRPIRSRGSPIATPGESVRCVRALRGARPAQGGRARPGGREQRDLTEPSLGGPKQRLVLALLLSDRPRASRSTGDRRCLGRAPPGGAPHTLQWYVSELRKAVGTSRARRHRLRLVDRPRQHALEFESLVSEARARRSTPHGGRRARPRARTLPRPTLRGLPRPGRAPERRRSRLEELRLTAVEPHCGRLDLGEHATMVGRARTPHAQISVSRGTACAPHARVVPRRPTGRRTPPVPDDTCRPRRRPRYDPSPGSPPRGADPRAGPRPRRRTN